MAYPAKHLNMFRLLGRAAPWAVMLALAMVLGLASVSAAKSVPGMSKKSDSSKKEEIAIPDAMTPEQMQAFMATLSDEQVRRVLLDELKRQAHAELVAKQAETAAQQGRPKTGSMQVLEHQSQDLREAMGVLGSGAAGLGDQLHRTLYRLVEGGGVGRLVLMLLMVAALFVAGLIGEVIWRRLTAGWQRNFTSGEVAGAWSLMVRVFQLGLREFLAAVIYLGCVVLFFVVFFSKTGMLHLLALYLFVPLLMGRVMGFFTTTFLAPRHPALRLIAMDGRDARWLRAWLVAFMVWVSTLGQTCMLLQSLGIRDDSFLFLYSLHGILGVAFLIVMVLVGRRRMDRAFAGPATDESQPKPRLLRVWPYLAIFYLLVIEFLWQAHFLLSGEDYIFAYLASLLGPFLLLMIDRVLDRLTKATGALRRQEPARRLPRPGEVDARMDGETKEEAAEREAETTPEQADALARLAQVAQKSRPQVLLPALQRVLRVILVVSMAVWLLHLWGLQLPWGGALMKAVLNILFTIFLAVLAWEFVSAMIDKRLRPQGDGHGGHSDGPGGAGGDRFQTLLSLARKALAAVIFIITAMIVLSSLGVDIGPLIAGAGVFGLAIGFGAQTLVRDIMSGIFFMVDDAFRIGDYVVAGGSMGTVEKLSIRSITLRHHLGMVQVLPYGQLKSVTNNSRDWIITKLKFKVPYGTDVKQVKKIVKKLNKRLMADEEWGPLLMAPLKSQGVKKLEDSAMVMAVKFMTKPGEQFMLKRLILDQIQKAFDKAGIQFAHRRVSVELPQEHAEPPEAENNEKEKPAEGAEKNEQPGPEAATMAGAAAMAVLIEEEEQAAAEKGKKKK